MAKILTPIWRQPYKFSNLALILVVLSITYSVFILYSWISLQIDWFMDDNEVGAYDYIKYESKPVVWLVIHLSCLLTALFICSFTIYYESVRSNQRQQRLKLEEESVAKTQHVIPRSPNVHLDSSPSKPPSADAIVIKVDKVLGEGSFGIVYEGKYLEENVAVKTFKSEDDPTIVLDLIREVKVMQTMGEHENIVAFKAVQLSEDCKIVIALELCPLGSLEKYLRKHGDAYRFKDGDEDGIPQEDLEKRDFKFSNNIVSSTLLRSFARQIASGMRYLAGKKLVHGDLAARNVLVCGKGDLIKISDFGFSREIHQSAYRKQKKGPLPYRWSALETLEMYVFSMETDVWSYAVTIWEIFTLGNVPFPMYSWNNEFIESLRGGMRLQKPEWAPNKVYDEIMLPCWNINPKSRPTFDTIEEFFINYEKEYILSENNSGKPTNIVHKVSLEQQDHFNME